MAPDGSPDVEPVLRPRTLPSSRARQGRPKRTAQDASSAGASRFDDTRVGLRGTGVEGERVQRRCAGTTELSFGLYWMVDVTLVVPAVDRG